MLLIFSTILKAENLSLIQIEGRYINDRFLLPSGFHRKSLPAESFGTYLRNLPLKQYGSKVLYYNGQEKSNTQVYCSVVDLPIGKKNLHQCADAVIHLRADYLFRNKRYSEISFHFTNGFKVKFSDWLSGKRVVVKGNQTFWVSRNIKINDYSEGNFWQYLELVFTFAGTISLKKELVINPVRNLNIGDVFIQDGSPGHAVIVVDKARNEAGEILFLLAQSYMPAQEIQILNNPNDKLISPWYSLPEKQLITPEWIFEISDLRKFSEK